MHNNESPLINNQIPAYQLTFLLAIFIFTFDEDLKNKYILNNVEDELFDFVGNLYGGSLRNITDVLTSLIYYGISFSPQKVNGSIEEAKNSLAILFNGDYFEGFYDLKKVIITYIQKMNLLPESRQDYA